MSCPTVTYMSSKPLVKIKLKELMQGSRKLILEHGGKPYLLSITRKGKLILTAADEKQVAAEASPGSTENEVSG